MARTVESFQKRIARGLRLSEDELREHLSTGNQDHLIWEGAHKPRLKKSKIVHTKHGIDRRVTAIPLFCLHYGIDDLDPRIQLRSDCGATSCISPFHRKMTQTYYGGAVVLPVLAAPQSSQVDLLVELLTFDEETYRNHPENLAHYPPTDVAEAFKRLGWL